MAKQKASRQKKVNVRVDFTPMVDMMMLLITFFMLCTSLSKPNTMQLTMPSNDANVNQNDKVAAKASQTLTIYLGGDDKIFYVHGLPAYDEPERMLETTWGSAGIRKVLIELQTEDGSVPVADIMKAKMELDKKRLDNPTQWPDSLYNKALEQIKNGELDGGKKVPTITVIIKATDAASYKNVVAALDEMQICSIGKYVIDKINPDDEALLKKKGVK